MVKCKVCQEQRAEYTCPRCNTRYCSLDCYKNHSNRCTEDFYRDNAVDHLRSVTATEQEKQHMLDILQRVYDRETQYTPSSSSYDDDNEYHGAEGGLSEATICRLLERGRLNEDGQLVDINPEDLSSEELEMFHKALLAGEIQGIEVWEPWWLVDEVSSLQLAKDGTALIQEQRQTTGSDDDDEATHRDIQTTTTSIPAPPLHPIPSLDTLTKVEPSPLLATHLVDIIYSYCFIMKRYNGEPGSDVPGVVTDLMALSSVLLITFTPTCQTVGEAVLQCLEKACRPPLNTESRQYAIKVLQDVVIVLQHDRSVIVTLLNDLRRIFHDASGSSGNSEVEDKIMKKKVAAAEKKVVFFMSWVNESSVSADLISASVLLVQAEYDKHIQTTIIGLESVAVGSSKEEEEEKVKKKIEEL